MLYVSKMPISELVIGLQKKHEGAFSVLYDDFSAALFGVILRIVKNKSASEEILQDVFVKIWKHIDTYDANKGTLFTWMLNITHNCCTDYFRSKRYKYQALLVQEDMDRIPMHGSTLTAEKSDESIDLQLIMTRLEPKYRDIIDLIYISGYTQEQVAEKLNLPLGTIKTRGRAALQKLRDCYELERSKKYELVYSEG